ncbi:Inner membrane protein YjcH [compost metagenome]
MLLVAFSPSTLGQSLSGGVTTVGMLVGVVIVGLAFALTGFYVYRANNVIDPLNEKLKQECAR